MRTIQFNVYEYAELSTEAQEKAFDDWSEEQRKDPHLLWHVGNEVLDSIKGCVEAFGGTLRDWSLSEWEDGDYLRVELDECFEEMGTPRLLKWTINNVLTKHGIQWHARKDGHCPFTGFGFDDDCLDEVIDDILAGCDLKASLEGMSVIYSRILQGERDYLSSKDAFEDCDRHELEFLEDGSLYA